MSQTRRAAGRLLRASAAIAILAVACFAALAVVRFLFDDARAARAPATHRSRSTAGPPARPGARVGADGRGGGFRPREDIDTSGYGPLLSAIPPWDPGASLDSIAALWKSPGLRAISELDRTLRLASDGSATKEVVASRMYRAMLLNSEGQAARAYEALSEARAVAEKDEAVSRKLLYTIVFFQGVAAMRRGENENCIECRGESSCILPIAEAAVHTRPDGSRTAIRHFTEYLERFPDDLEVRWLLNIAHMTLGEHPQKVDPRYVISLDRFRESEFDIGKFRDIGHLAGVNRFNQAGGAILEDFDNDGLLDVAVTSLDPAEHMAIYRNKGDGTFEDRTKAAGVTGQFGGLYCVQTDYNNDGFMDIYIPRAAWIPIAIRPSLLRNNRDGTFTDVTREAGLLDPVNSISATWADYDNDGWLDLFLCCERQPCRLYHNLRNGTFEEVARTAGLLEEGRPPFVSKGANWIDFDNDDYPDLFLARQGEPAELYRNNRDGTFSDVSMSMGIDGPRFGFSCWAWDYDNDGWLDLFATCYDRTLADIVKGLVGQPHARESNRLFRNLEGKGFEDRTKEAGLDLVFATMGSNYGDFDNDGFLDFYLGTGDPNFTTLVPNRMFKNVGGVRFAEITGTSGTGHLQKGHGVACGDWDRDGDVDLFIEMGGTVLGDRYHNILFQNPGQGNHWLTVKLVGQKTNRAAIGARIKVVTAGKEPLTVHRHVSSGSSFGASPLQQTIGLAKAGRVALLEVHWPASGTTQVFRDIAADQAIEVTEFATSYRPMGWKPIPQPE